MPCTFRPWGKAGCYAQIWSRSLQPQSSLDDMPACIPTASRPSARKRLSVLVQCVAEAVKPPTQTFSSISSEAQFFASLSTAVSAGKAPEKLLQGFKILYTNYKSRSMALAAPLPTPQKPAPDCPASVQMQCSAVGLRGPLSRWWLKSWPALLTGS